MKTLVLAEHNGANLSAATLSVVDAAKQLGREVDLLLTNNSCTSVLEEAKAIEGVSKVLNFSHEKFTSEVAEDVAACVVSVSSEYDFFLASSSTSGKNNLPRIAALLDTVIKFENKKELVLVFNNEKAGKISCHLLDPSIISKPIFSKSSGSILMSGTLYPPTMYSDILGLTPLKNVTLKEYISPFESHNKPISIATNVTTRYKQRGPENTRKICEHIYSVAKEAPGHIAVFAPSYKLLNEFIDNEGWPNRLVIKEKSDWKKSEIDQIIPDLEKYRKNKQKILLAGVFGGKLSEGIDFNNNILDAVICIGIPVPPPSVFSDALKEFLETKFGRNKGWLYGSMQPAVNSVIQAMGRPIRSSKDKAFIVLLDSRHLDQSYRKCHPENFSPLICNDSETTRRYIARFFSKIQRS